MKKLSEYQDEEALDLLADLLDPVVMVFGDSTVSSFLLQKNYIGAVKHAIKFHKKEVVEIMATLEGVPVDEFHYNFITLPKMLLEILNDPPLLDFFTSQGEEASVIPFGSATENTEDQEK